LCCALQVTQSLVDHLNTNLKAAVDKADDAEAEAAQVKQQVSAVCTENLGRAGFGQGHDSLGLNFARAVPCTVSCAAVLH
jgi:hypothetical protein